MKLLAAILSYYPDLERLSENIDSIRDHVDEILILENTPPEHCNEYRIPEDGKTHHLTTGDKSISKALNLAWHYAQDHGFDSLLTLDQDSVFVGLDRYVSFCESEFEKQPCIIGAWIDESVSEDDPVPYAEKERIITAGMMVPIELLNRVGGYYEKFDVDAIDIEFCYRVRQCGHKVLMFKHASTQQRYGSPYTKKFLGHVVEGHNYPPSRLYGIIRNHLVIYRHFGHPSYLRKDIIRYFRIFLPAIILVEKNKFQKLSSLIGGFFAGLHATY